MTWEKIGEIAVDSGTFMICDPCYMEDKKCLETIKKERMEYSNNTQLSFPSKGSGLAVIGATEVGDGVFDVFARTNSKGHKEIKITFA